MLLYDGLHYDALVLAFEGAPQDMDITIHSAVGGAAEAALGEEAPPADGLPQEGEIGAEAADDAVPPEGVADTAQADMA